MPIANPVVEDVAELRQFLAQLGIDQKQASQTRWLLNLYPTSRNLDLVEDYYGNDPWEEVEFYAYPACYALRELAKGFPGSESMLMNVGVHRKPVNFAENARLEDWNKEGEKPTEELELHANNLAAYLEAAYGFRDRRDVTEGGTRVSDLGDPDDPRSDCGDVVIVNRNPADRWGSDAGDKGGRLALSQVGHGRGGDRAPEKWREALAWDNCPDEDVEDDEYILSMTIPSRHFEKSPESYQSLLYVQRHQIVRDNKMFAFGYDRLTTVPELASIEVGCRRKAERALSKPVLSEQQLRQAEDNVLSLSTLYLGLDRSRKLVFVDSEGSAPEHHAALFTSGDGMAMYRMRVPFPDYRHFQAPVPGLDRHRDPYVLLPDYAELAPLLLALKRHRDGQGAITAMPAAGPVFREDPQEYRSRLKRLLKDIDPYKRMTLSRVERALFGNVMSRTGGDVVAATMASGYESRLSRVPMFYGCRSFENINHIFYRVVSAMRREISGAAPAFYPIPGSEGRYSGARLCPTTLAIQQAIGRLVASLENDDLSDLYDYHCRYTLLTALWFGYSTMIRGIKSPLVTPEEISQLNHMALVRDKSSDSGDKVKFSFIESELEQQLCYYRDHVRRLRIRSHWPWFFVGQNGVEEVSPTTIERHLAKFLSGFPPAVHRRVTFNALIEAGCPPESVRVAMGHSTIGDEPHSGWSTFSFSRHCEILESYLKQVLPQFGFRKAIKSKLL